MVAGAALLLGGCASLGERDGAGEDESRSLEQVLERSATERPAPEGRVQRSSRAASRVEPLPLDPDASAVVDTDDEERVQLFPGTGRFFDEDRARQPARIDPETGDLTLNFERADLTEVAHFILGEQLGENYVVDPAVSGEVTLQTSRPLSRDDLLPTLENLLQMNSAALVQDDGLFRVVPREGALRGQVPRLDSGQPGMNVRIVPLEYIAVSEMAKILEPFTSSGAVVRTDPARNMLILAGNRQQLGQWLETIEIFDVNWLEGMSVGMFTLANADVQDIVGELEGLFGPDSESPVAGLFRFIPVERLNAILAITPQEEYLREAREWVERLDRGRDPHSTRLHVHRLEHGKAGQVADLLSQLFDGEPVSDAPAADEDSPSLAPGMEEVRLGAEDSGEGNPNDNGGAADAPETRATAVSADESSMGGALEGDVRILADETNNALLIMASERDYEILRDALRELDIAPRQVLVDASIVEVTLRDELRYGLQWFFENSMGSYEGRGIFGTSSSADISRQFPGFNYSLVDNAGEVRAVLSALAEDSRVEVLSSPSIMVLDNHSATIRVGDQVPVRTSETTSAVTDNPVIVSNIQFRDTGVNLEVTPRVNSGGMVTLDVFQEVNDVSQTTTSGIDSPTIQQRLIESSVAVQSGETIVLGGLIRESTDVSEQGIPGLRSIPLMGNLFGATSEATRRTELLVLLTPRVANDSAEVRAITEDFRRHMHGIEARGAELRRHDDMDSECGENVTDSCEKNNESP